MKAKVITPNMQATNAHQKINILLVEDEPIIGEDLRRTLTKMEYHVLDVLSSGEEAIEFVKEQAPDLILMDIQLDGHLDGVDAAHEISKLHPIPIIYLTSNTDDRTFTRAKLTQPFAFLSKPYRIKDVAHAIDLAFTDGSSNQATLTSEKESRTQRVKDHVFAKSQGHLVKISLKDILYVEADSCYCNIYTNKGKQVIVSTLKSFDDAIASEEIVRVHRSFMVNLNAIDKVGDGLIYVHDRQLPIGRSYKEVLYGLLPKL